MRFIQIFILMLVLLAACYSNPTAPTVTVFGTATSAPAPTTTTSQEPSLLPDIQTYLDNAIDLMEDHSIYTGAADWAEARAVAYQKAESAETILELHPIIVSVLRAIGDRHGYLMGPGDVDSYHGELLGESLPEPQYELLNDQIGYISIPGFFSGNMDSAVEFSELIQSAIELLDARNPCGWVLDLRGNEGGNGFAMLLGVSPLLPEGTLGMYTYNGGKTKEWRTQGNQIFLGETRIMVMEESAYRLKQPSSPVAVITNEITTSAGEFVAVAFRGWAHTRSFGQHTLGQTTAPEGFQLEDGAVLGISVAYFSDHTGQIYSGEITPDDPIISRENPIFRDNSVPQEAIDWLLNQEICQTALQS
jgi:hypothetical protein